MSSVGPLFRSPIRPHEPIATPALTLRDLSGVPIVLIQSAVNAVLTAQFAALPEKSGAVSELAGGLLARLTPTQFYLFGTEPGANVPTAATLDAAFRVDNLFAHATDLTAGTAVLRLSGSAAPQVLSKLCALNFHATKFPNLQAAQSSIAKIKALIVRYDDGALPGYFLHVDAPSGQYFWETILDAGQEFVA